MIKVNYHTHTAYCGHAQGCAAEYAEEAFRKGLSKLGFSDHLPFWQDIYEYRMTYAQMPDYIRDVQALKRQYSGKMEIFCGFEGEYLRGQEAWYEKLLTDGSCDYLIMGQHMFADNSGNLHVSAEMSSTEEYMAYTDSLIEGMNTGFFKLIAHPDFMFINTFAWDIFCERACDKLMDAAAAGGFVLEYNANGYRRGICEFDDGPRYQYPHELFWKKAAKAGAAVVIGSDCHEPSQVFDTFVEKAYRDTAALSLHVITDLF